MATCDADFHSRQIVGILFVAEVRAPFTSLYKNYEFQLTVVGAPGIYKFKSVSDMLAGRAEQCIGFTG